MIREALPGKSTRCCIATKPPNEWPEQRPVLELELGREPLDGAGEAGQRPLVGVAVRRVAVAGQVGEQHPVALGELLDARQEDRAVEPGAGVQEQDGRALAQLADVHQRGAASSRKLASACAAVSGASS